MRTIMARCPHESSFSYSKRHLQWIVAKVTGNNEAHDEVEQEEDEEEEDDDDDALTFPFSESKSVPVAEKDKKKKKKKKKKRKSLQIVSVIRSVFTAKNRPSKVAGTLFGHRRGHIQIAFQMDCSNKYGGGPTVLFELAMPTNTLIKEMASGLVRIALESEQKGYSTSNGKAKLLLEETLWRAYCNGSKCGYAVRRECGPHDWKVMNTVGPVSMGAGVLPGIDGGGGGGEGEMMYMRARFERVVGSKDSEAFYMMNPDGNAGPELSIYLLRN